MTQTLVRDVSVRGRHVDVLTSGSRVVQIGVSLEHPTADVIEGRGGALFPGLNDHHLHLLAMAARHRSVDVSTATDMAQLRTELAGAGGNGWVRAVGYHESIAGPLDRFALDRLVSDRPLRVQHRGGALWMLNTLALSLVEDQLDRSPDVERDDHGRPNGRLWRYDAKLRFGDAVTVGDLERVGRTLSEYGVTGVTDATPELESSAAALIAAASGVPGFPFVQSLGISLEDSRKYGVAAGPWKILLRDHDLPPYQDLIDQIKRQHEKGRAVAVHCVTVESLVLTMTALTDAGSIRGDRIEHASIVPDGIGRRLKALGVAVVTQPGFVHARGDRYLQDVDERDHDFLYPWRSLQDIGVRVAPSSDAPFGEADPWFIMRSAHNRLTAAGRTIGSRESVAPGVALDGYLSPLSDPGGPPREVRVGVAADLMLLMPSQWDVPWQTAHPIVVATAVKGVWHHCDA